MAAPARPNPIPDSYRRVTPCLTVQGAAKALEFYAAVFGAVLASLPALDTRLVAFDTESGKTNLPLIDFVEDWRRRRGVET